MKEILSGTRGSHIKRISILNALLQELFFSKKKTIKWWCFSFLFPIWNLREIQYQQHKYQHKYQQQFSLELIYILIYFN